jgi:hypothetical protein
MRSSVLPLPLLLLVLWAPARVAAEDAEADATFADRVNRAIELGTNWLLARPAFFTSGKIEMAHFGLIGSDRLYGGGEATAETTPAGTTALALYALL